ncbi:LysM peptidoglycan-binding domain-containing protein [Arthrobacter sp. L77]|uniref:LysM peptidoglycan-binding domain-containing protein n=1 Tax=Arthrobacter sp. L77 TaxID=1496689 RepID=UPI00068C320F|nr:glycosyl hydrolase family 18 protein [Arthrobacter sp. L77]
MTTRRSFLRGAAWMAVLPHLALGTDQGALDWSSRGAEPVPAEYPYDAPIPDMRSKITNPLPRRVIAGYWTYWGSPIRLKDIPARYNTVFLFHATPVGGAGGTSGAVQWNAPGDGRGAASNFREDLAEFRETRTAILSVGGAQAHVDLSTRARAQAFLDSIKRIHGDLGGFDGLDWNNYEGGQRPDTEQMIWVSLQLKSTYGKDFAITSPPAPWRPDDMTHCRAMIDAGVMDMVSPQYYDGAGLTTEGYIVNSVNEWVARMGDAGRVGVGFGLGDAADRSDQAVVEGAWKSLAARHPELRGAYTWDLPMDERMGWPFAENIAPLVMLDLASASPPPVIIPPVFPIRVRAADPTHTVVAGDTLQKIAVRYGVDDWREIAALNGDPDPESLRVGHFLRLPPGS